MYKHFFKPLIGKTLSIIGLIVCFIPMIIIAIAIKLDSKGPVFFRQERLGKDQKPFRIIKFRSMCVGAFEKGGIATQSDDARITRIGAILRRTSLDEIPQMINILLGQMAIIGPRPILSFEFAPYKDNIRFCRRYDVTPGMFCTVDVYNRAADRDVQMEYDADYSKKQSFLLDLRTFFRVIRVVISGNGVYREEVGSHNNHV